MVKEWFSALHDSLWRKNLMRSGMVTGLIVVVVLIGLTAAYRAHMLGNFHRLKAKISTEQQDAPVPRPGGLEAIVLTRTRTMKDATPEFLSVTMLPGRGMNVLQITAYVPGKGEVSLLASPTVEGAAKAMTGHDEDANGQTSLGMGGAFEAPWAGSIWGMPAQEGGSASLTWRGQAIKLPTTGGVASGGLMLAQAADTSGSEALPDGGSAQAVFHSADYGGRWPSQTDVTVTVLLNSRSVDLTVEAVNTGDSAEPIGIGWHPRFAIADGHREQVRLSLPAEMRAEVDDREQGRPTGTLHGMAGTPFDFTMRGGATLGAKNLNDCFAGLHQNLLEVGPTAELSDPADGYGVRVTAVSPTIRAMCVTAPESANFVSIDPQFNYPDPLGPEWTKESDTGMVVLGPGQSTRWKVRLELFPVASGASPR